MAQIFIIGYSFQLILDYLFHLILDAVVVAAYHISHTILEKATKIRKRQVSIVRNRTCGEWKDTTRMRETRRGFERKKIYS